MLEWLDFMLPLAVRVSMGHTVYELRALRTVTRGLESP
jgi:hypothetical protein